jgi:hypothetical protein
MLAQDSAPCAAAWKAGEQSCCIDSGPFGKDSASGTCQNVMLLDNPPAISTSLPNNLVKVEIAASELDGCGAIEYHE